MRGKRSTLKKSSLEKISGIGAVKASALLKAFGGLAGVKSATVEQLRDVKGISESDALNIEKYFKNKI
jgi:excinuclease ABC subunit C